MSYYNVNGKFAKNQKEAILMSKELCIEELRKDEEGYLPNEEEILNNSNYWSTPESKNHDCYCGQTSGEKIVLFAEEIKEVESNKQYSNSTAVCEACEEEN